jgi:nucleoside-diphosphate-sugar epimerase
MKILVTGNQGYIGEVLTEELLKLNYKVIGLDIGLYENCSLVPTNKKAIKQITKDIRDIDKYDLKNIDCVIHLAALSNDPLGELNPKLTEEINFLGLKKIADLSKVAGVKRFVYVSSQSMYGISNADYELDEYDSEKKPVTKYAKTKWQAEQYINTLNDANFTVVSFRPSTVFGASPKLRCDIVFNNLVACAYTTNKIEIKSDGSPWRPVIHVRDVCSALIAGLNAPSNLISAKSFNVGIHNGNYRVKDLANVVKEVLPNCEIIFTNEHLIDSRSYKVSFNRILNDLKDYFKPEWDLKRGVHELINFFDQINFTEEDFRGKKTNRIKNIKSKININIDNDLRNL